MTFTVNDVSITVEGNQEVHVNGNKVTIKAPVEQEAWDARGYAAYAQLALREHNPAWADVQPAFVTRLLAGNTC